MGDEDEEYEYEDVVEENEFQGRDAQGLKESETEPNTEQAEMKKYGLMLLVYIPVVQIILAVGVYALAAKAFKQQATYDSKFKLIHDHQLGWVYLAVYMISLMRTVLIINSNGARAPARVDRPDQHVYKIMDKDGINRDAPYVLMAGTGPQGRFNRAQRGVFNTDEALPLVLANTLLTGFVFGPVICIVLLVVMYGRMTFGFKYKEASASRGAGFMPAMIGEGIIAGLLIICTVKGLFPLECIQQHSFLESFECF